MFDNPGNGLNKCGATSREVGRSWANFLPASAKVDGCALSTDFDRILAMSTDGRRRIHEVVGCRSVVGRTTVAVGRRSSVGCRTLFCPPPPRSRGPLSRLTTDDGRRTDGRTEDDRPTRLTCARGQLSLYKGRSQGRARASGKRPRRPEGRGRPNIRPDPASPSSELNENRCNRRFSMWWSRILRSRTDPAHW